MNSLVTALAAALAAAAASAGAQPASASPADAASAALANPLHCDARPEYPLEAVRHDVQGTTTIEITFGPDGAAATSRVAVASGPRPENALLDQAALAAMASCRLEHREATAVTRRMTYSWRLDGSGDPDLAPGVQAERERLRQLAAANARLPADAERGIVPSQLELARQYAGGDGRPRDDELASRWFRRAAEAGNVDAQVYYGQRLVAGKGVARDDEAGAAWLRKAAAQGSGSAAYGLGLFARAGRGMPASDAAAFDWFLKGAQAGTRAAMTEVADAYAKGIGTPRDDAQAARWYLAAAPYDMHAAWQLGLAYRDGLGVPVDPERAAFCMTVARMHSLSRRAGDVPATVLPQLDAAAQARVLARAQAWKVGEPLFE